MHGISQGLKIVNWLICETKLDLSFPRTQFHINGFEEP